MFNLRTVKLGSNKCDFHFNKEVNAVKLLILNVKLKCLKVLIENDAAYISESCHTAFKSCDV